MKKQILFLFIVIIAMSIFAISASAADIGLGVELDNGMTIKAIEDVIYLPSYVDIHNVKIVYANGKGVTLDGTAFTSGASIDLTKYLKKDKDSRATYYELCFKTTATFAPDDIVYIYKSNNLPSVFISTSIGADKMIDDNVTDSATSVTIYDNDGTAEINNLSAEVRVRGNSTPTYAKKPFQIKFEKKTDVFGMGKAKTWLLLANYLDQSYIRNSIMYKLAKELGMGASDFQNVEVFVDGKYQGVYLLCEKVNINANRVNINELEDENELLNPEYGDKLMSSTETVTEGALIDETIIKEYKYVKELVNPTDITGGYLIELDNNSKGDRAKLGSYFITETSYGENLYVIKSPEYCSREQVEYIARLFAEMEEAMASTNGINSQGKHYTEYIDLESFAVAYIMAELGRNCDAGSASIFFNKDIDVNGEPSKIIKGPLWDCDNVLGNIHRNNAQVQTDMWAKNRTPWNMLTNHADFINKVKEKFEIAYNIIYDMLDACGFVDEQIDEIGYSARMDRLRWKQYDEESWPLYSDGSLHWFNQKGKKTFPTYSVYTDFVNNTKDTAVGYLCLILQERTDYLVGQWGCEVTARTRTLNAKPAEIPSSLLGSQPSEPSKESSKPTQSSKPESSNSATNNQTSTQAPQNSGGEGKRGDNSERVSIASVLLSFTVLALTITIGVLIVIQINKKYRRF